METQTWLSRHNKFISPENTINTIFFVSSDDYLQASLSSHVCVCVFICFGFMAYQLL